MCGMWLEGWGRELMIARDYVSKTLEIIIYKSCKEYSSWVIHVPIHWIRALKP